MSISFGIADASIEFSRGALQAILAPVQRPALELSGNSIRDLHGTRVFADRGLRALVTWPGGTGDSQKTREQSYELIVAGGGPSIERLALSETIDSLSVLNVGPHFEGSPRCCGGSSSSSSAPASDGRSRPGWRCADALEVIDGDGRRRTHRYALSGGVDRFLETRYECTITHAFGSTEAS